MVYMYHKCVCVNLGSGGEDRLSILCAGRTFHTDTYLPPLNSCLLSIKRFPTHTFARSSPHPSSTLPNKLWVPREDSPSLEYSESEESSSRLISCSHHQRRWGVPRIRSPSLQAARRGRSSTHAAIVARRRKMYLGDMFMSGEGEGRRGVPFNVSRNQY